MIISSFSGKNRFLSNFYPHPFVAYDGLEYPSMEHWLHCGKFEGVSDTAWQAVYEASTPREAKKVGRRFKLQPLSLTNWHAKRLSVMRSGLTYKFHPDGDLAVKLLETGDDLLVEGNTWGDQFWGATEDPTQTDEYKRWVGHNWLGVLLMAQRAYLRSMYG